MITIEEANVSNLECKVFGANRQEFLRVFHHVLTILNCLLYSAVSVQQKEVSLRVVDVSWVFCDCGHHVNYNFKILL